MNRPQNIVFLPCRSGSQRVPHKNTRDFAGIQGGLLAIKLSQLLQVDSVDQIILSSNDSQVLQIGERLNNNIIKVIPRPQELCTSLTSTDQLIDYVTDLIPQGTIIWTHVTSPFLSASTYQAMIRAYYDGLHRYDSLMSVRKLQTFLWNEQVPVNYDRKKEKWPRTQTLEPLYEVNSGVFIADAKIYQSLHDRVGKCVQLFETKGIENIDIDWQEDFLLAEQIWKSKTL